MITTVTFLWWDIFKEKSSKHYVHKNKLQRVPGGNISHFIDIKLINEMFIRDTWMIDTMTNNNK